MFVALEIIIQESLGFGLFVLICSHILCSHLMLLKEKWLGGNGVTTSLLGYVTGFKTRLHGALVIARQNPKLSQDNMKTWCAKKPKNCSFKPGVKVLVFLPITSSPLQAKYFVLYTIKNKITGPNYIVTTHD